MLRTNKDYGHYSIVAIKKPLKTGALNYVVEQFINEDCVACHLLC